MGTFPSHQVLLAFNTCLICLSKSHRDAPVVVRVSVCFFLMAPLAIPKICFDKIRGVCVDVPSSSFSVFVGSAAAASYRNSSFDSQLLNECIRLFLKCTKALEGRVGSTIRKFQREHNSPKQNG